MKGRTAKATMRPSRTSSSAVRSMSSAPISSRIGIVTRTPSPSRSTAAGRSGTQPQAPLGGRLQEGPQAVVAPQAAPAERAQLGVVGYEVAERRLVALVEGLHEAQRELAGVGGRRRPRGHAQMGRPPGRRRNGLARRGR